MCIRPLHVNILLNLTDSSLAIDVAETWNVKIWGHRAVAIEAERPHQSDPAKEYHEMEEISFR